MRQRITTKSLISALVATGDGGGSLTHSAPLSLSQSVKKQSSQWASASDLPFLYHLELGVKRVWGSKFAFWALGSKRQGMTQQAERTQ